MDYHFEEIESTNMWMKQNIDRLKPLSIVTADFQTAGRGQRGNTWESERGKNLLMSLLIAPKYLPAREQFIISKMVSVALCRVLQAIMPDGLNIEIKWPNDIYISRKKVCGMLIENALGQNGMIQHSVVGIGLNVNQTDFHSDAPNPASLVSFIRENSQTGHTVDDSHPSPFQPLELAERIRQAVAEYLDKGFGKAATAELDNEYWLNLRGRGEYLRYAVLTPSCSPAPTALRDAPGHEIIEATIENVASDGRLDMLLRDGGRRSFYFKEIAPVL